MVQIPVYVGAWQTVYSCKWYPREKTAIAISMFYMEWNRTFGDPGNRVWRAMNRIYVDWSPQSRRGNAYNITGDRVDDASFGGLALTPSYIWVKPHVDELMCETALAHELVHISIWAVKGTDGDPDHMGSKYHGWTVDHSALIQRINDSLCSLGI
jgi:hypothetical protein